MDVCAKLLSRVPLFVTPWMVALQAFLSMGFFRQDHWNGLPFPSPGDFPDTGIKPTSLMSPALAGKFFTTSATWEAPVEIYCREKKMGKGCRSGSEFPSHSTQHSSLYLLGA